MTKKNLTWRLKDLPDAIDVAELVDKKIITPEEARDLLFNEGKNEGKKIKELEEEVKFLRDLCDSLANKANSWPIIVEKYREYVPRYPYWYRRYEPIVITYDSTTSKDFGVGSAISANGKHTLTTGSTGTTYSVAVGGSSTIKGLSSLN